MTYFSGLEIEKYIPVNHLWTELVGELGIDRAQKAVRESLDLQRMYGSNTTLPVLLVETCGLALTRVDLVREKTGFPCYGNGMVLLLSIRKKFAQLIHEV